MSVEKLHATLSPSATDRWWSCPGSVAACEGLKSTSSSYAIEGTVAHDVLEKCLKGKLNPFDFVGLDFQDVEVTEEMAEAVSMAIDFVDAELQKGGFLLAEEKVDVVPGEVWGHLDIAIVRPFDHLIVADFKYGKGIAVKAEYNYQMLNYLLGMSKLHETETFELVILQPRVEEEPIRWICPPDTLETFEAELIRHVAMTKEASAMLVPGSHCKWCLAKATCSALRGEIGGVLAPVKNSALLFPDVKMLTIEQVVKLLDHKDQIEKWLAAISASAFEMLEDGKQVPGYTLAKKRANRRWADEVKVTSTFADLGDEIYTLKLKSPAQIEKLIGKARKSEVSNLTEIPDNGYTMKKEG